MKKFFLIIVLTTTLFLIGCGQQPLAPVIAPNQNDEQKNDIVGINDNVLNQLSFFESYLDDILQASNDCIVLANYNNLSMNLPQKELKEAFPKDKQFYSSNCQKSFTTITSSQDIIAEPELVDLRKITSEYTKIVKNLAVFALDGKSNTVEIDKYDAERKEFFTQAQEEILRLKRIYSVK